VREVTTRHNTDICCGTLSTAGEKEEREMATRVSDVINNAMAPTQRIAGTLARTFFTHEGLRLRTSIRLRWLAVAGQTFAVLWVFFGMRFDLPLGWCLTFIALSAWVNIALSLSWSVTAKLHERYSSALLAYDIIQLAALLYLTGGLSNPFAFLFIVPVTVSAATLPWSRTVLLACLAVAMTTLLAVTHFPLPWYPDQPLVLPNLYKTGLWVALVCGVIFSTLYVNRVASEARDMANALAATEVALAHEQQLSALDGLAAAAAHELGTPLATIVLVAKELKRELKLGGHHGEDLDLLVSQSERCREILSRLSRRDNQSDAMMQTVRMTALAEEIAEPLNSPEVAILFDVQPKSDRQGKPLPEPVLVRNTAIKYALVNLMENAVDFAKTRVTVRISWSLEQISLTISDDGAGFSQAVMDRLGDPYVTSRSRYGDEESSRRDGHGGMGLGFFIAKTLLERSGAQVNLANRAGPDTGAVVRMVWPRETLEVPQAERTVL
jgi:two-component system sensor histidine kinase RegB